MLKILIASQAAYGACSWYRSVGVFSWLRKLANIQIKMATADMQWSDLAECDLVFIERPTTNYDVSFMEHARAMRIPVWVDFDDDLWNLPDWNPARGFFNRQETIQCLQAGLNYADVFSVTTPALKEIVELRAPGKRIEVIPNAFNDFVHVMPEKPSSNQIINWRGSRTHRGDLLPLLEEFELAAKDNPEWKFHFLGGSKEDEFWFLREALGRQFWNTQETHQLGFWMLLRQINPAIHVCPLTEHVFNEAKSNISWIEGVYSGAAVVGPIMPEWMRPGVSLYDPAGEARLPRDFAKAIQSLIDDQELRAESWKKSRDYILENLRLSEINKLRLAIVNDLCGVGV